MRKLQCGLVKLQHPFMLLIGALVEGGGGRRTAALGITFKVYAVSQEEYM